MSAIGESITRRNENNRMSFSRTPQTKNRSELHRFSVTDNRRNSNGGYGCKTRKNCQERWSP